MKIFLISATCFLCTISIAQTRMLMMADGKQNDILGYTMDPDGTGNKQSISIFGPLQNAGNVFQMSYQSGNPIDNIVIAISDANSPGKTINLSGVAIYGIKEYTSTYSNGTFNISASGNANTELKCKFQKIVMQEGGSGSKVNDMSNGMEQKSNGDTPMWDIQPDATLTGVGGSISMQIPKGLSFSTHMLFYNAGDNKKSVASWFGNNVAKLLPGLYDIVVDGKYTIKNVPVEKGKDTRLNMGIFKVTTYGSVQIEDSNHQKFTYAGPFSIVLPAGTYYLGGKKQPIVITTGKVTEL